MVAGKPLLKFGGATPRDEVESTPNGGKYNADGLAIHLVRIMSA